MLYLCTPLAFQCRACVCSQCMMFAQWCFGDCVRRRPFENEVLMKLQALTSHVIPGMYKHAPALALAYIYEDVIFVLNCRRDHSSVWLICIRLVYS